VPIITGKTIVYSSLLVTQSTLQVATMVSFAHPLVSNNVPTTIGNGANDVSMIQVADVEVGNNVQARRQTPMVSYFAMG
jgi:hypothetical protein